MVAGQQQEGSNSEVVAKGRQGSCDRGVIMQLQQSRHGAAGDKESLAVSCSSVAARANSHLLFGLVNSKKIRRSWSQFTAQASGRFLRVSAPESTWSPSSPPSRSRSEILSQALCQESMCSACGAQPKWPSTVCSTTTTHFLAVFDMPFHSNCAKLWCARILASLRAGQGH